MKAYDISLLVFVCVGFFRKHLQFFVMRSLKFKKWGIGNGEREEGKEK